MFAGRHERVTNGVPPLHYYGPVGDDIVLFPDASTFTVLTSGRWSSRAAPIGRECGGLWRVSTFGRSATRPSAGSVGTPLSLTRNQLAGTAPLPAGLVTDDVQLGWRPSLAWIEVRCDGGGYGRTVRIDPGQTIYVDADTVDLGVWAPSTFAVVPYDGQDRPQTITNFGETPILEGIIYGDIARVEVARQQGQEFALLTETYVNDTAEAPNGFRFVPVPPGARRVHISRDGSGATTSTFWYEAFSAATGVRTSILPIVNRSLVGGPLPVGSCTQLAMPLLLEPALWTLRWEISV